MKIAIPDFALVCLIGPTGSGKSSFAGKHFLETEIISSDHCRALVSDDETDQSATADAFDLLQHTARLRLRRRRLTVIDATSVRREDRAQLVNLAREQHALPVALVFDIDPAICMARNEGRQNRPFRPTVPRDHSRELRRGLKNLQREGFRQVHIMRTPAEADAVAITREPLWTDRRADHGPFDIVGDVHGCFEELAGLLAMLGYSVDRHEEDGEALIAARHPEGRRAFFVGDLTDRGPLNVRTLRLVMGMCAEGSAECIMGNHDYKLGRWLQGRDVKLSHGLAETVAELEQCSPAFRKQVASFIDGLRSHAWLDDGKLVVAHAGLKEEMHGRGSPAVRSFAMFGDTTGEVDEFGLPVRLPWARDYRGRAAVAYGHTPTLEADWLNNTICIDTGCAFGGKLTALRWPERDLVSVPALRQYAAPARPLDTGATATAQQDYDRLLYFDDFLGTRRVETRFGSTVVVPEENGLAALELVSRFGIDPRWLIYVPPTMAACPTAPEGPFLEHPRQAIDFFVSAGVTDLVAEEKHMGSRALIVVARDADAARARFGVEDARQGVVYTRTGRPFFDNPATEAAIVERVGLAAGRAGLWQELGSDWLLLDAELMPWSAKAQELLRRQYRPTAAAAMQSAEALIAAIEVAPDIDGLSALRERASLCQAKAVRMNATIDGYCWPAEAVDDYRVAPFHLLAAEGRVFTDRPHSWHMETLHRLCEGEPILRKTAWRRFDAADADACRALVDWWYELTGSGGEGLVLKPHDFVAHKGRSIVQPAMKVRGRDYLRIIYGPEYDAPENIERLRQRGLARKFQLAEREFKLGFEGLHRFVERKPLHQVHECALAVLALESEPVDPRL